jgi:hypothetical protein
MGICTRAVLAVLLLQPLALKAQVGELLTPLIRAARAGNTALVRELLRSGADPNQGRFRGAPVLSLALFQQDRDMFEALVDAGADLTLRATDGSTALMWSVYGDSGYTDFTQPILKAGVDVNAKSAKGDTALSMAVHFGNWPAARKLTEAGATYDPLIREAVRRALAIVQPSGVRFFRSSGCVSCHHQNLPAMAAAAAREHGIPLDEGIEQQQTKTVAAVWQKRRDNLATTPDASDAIPYSLLGLAAAHYAADDTVRAMVQRLEEIQRPNGRWNTIARRPPLEGSPITATAISARALRLYGGDGQRVDRALTWLAQQEPRTGEERSMQVLGLAWAGGQDTVLQKRAGELLAQQRSDGGWAQTGALECDAYATGQALVALRTAGILKPGDETYEKGVFFLLRTQFDDGSWLIRSRTIPIQPHVETGFPHGANQFISAAGTSWAVIALSSAAK